MIATRRLFLSFCFCGALLAASVVGPKLPLAHRRYSYVSGAVDPSGVPYGVAFGEEGPGAEPLASEGPWGVWPEDYCPDRLYAGAG